VRNKGGKINVKESTIIAKLFILLNAAMVSGRSKIKNYDFIIHLFR